MSPKINVPTAVPTTTDAAAAAWRAGRPAEDPEKTKRWGIITAKPSEYLIHMRRGKIRRRTTGQGASCFKWPWDSVAIIPTTINRLQFTADQVTREKVGVQITGLAVYRIVEPELTFRMLNFSYSERASEKLGDILQEMLVGATRRLVANLTIEDVMTRRKEAIAGELLIELAPVVEGRGRGDDSTATGWGVVLDTVEVQNVRVLSETVFNDMQARFRAELAMRARTAELENAREIATIEAASSRAIEEAKITADSATRELRAQAESRSTQIELTEDGKREQLRARAAEEKSARDQARALAELRDQAAILADKGAREQARQLAELRGRAEVEAEKAKEAEAARLAQLARDRKLAEAERQVLEAKHQNATREAEMAAALHLQKARVAVDLEELKSAAAAKIQQRELEMKRLAGEVQLAVTRATREIENLVSDDKIRLALVETGLPAVASAFAQKFGEVKFTAIGGGDAADPSAMIGKGIAQVIELVRTVGADVLGPRPEA
jgi:regulator of protease activity HflC (stomatin/prohibitin superfamily)